MSITDAETGVRRASYAPKSCSLRDLQGLAVLKDAFKNLKKVTVLNGNIKIGRRAFLAVP
jgi:hypothetical protein